MTARAPLVIKVGGAHLDEPNYLDALVGHVNRLLDDGRRVILVHGGGKEIATLHEALDVPYRKQLGLRVTSEASMDLVAMVLCGLVNKRLVARFAKSDACAVGVCGADCGLMRAQFLNYEQLGRVGGPPDVSAKSFERLLETTQLVIVAPVCMGPDDALVNVNADTAAQAIAVALHAEGLDFITDVPGVALASGVASRLAARQVEGLVRSSIVGGGMIPKLQASVAALAGGVGKVRVGSLDTLREGSATEVHP